MKTYIAICVLALASTGVAALNVPIYVATMASQNAMRQAQAKQEATRKTQAAQAAASAASAPKETK